MRVKADSLPVPLEIEEQLAVIAYCDLKGHKYTAIPNDTGHTPEAKRRAVRMKRQGVRKGFPDMLILVNNTFITIEMKRVRGSTTSLEQKQWHVAISKTQVPTKICKGAKDAIEFIKQYER